MPSRVIDPRLLHRAGAAAIALVGALAYSNTFEGTFVFDDLVNILRNPFLRWTEFSFENLYRAMFLGINQRPIANLSFALNYYFAGYAVGPFHIVNLAVHITNALLVQALARCTFELWARLSSQGGTRRDTLSLECAALLAGLLFVAHPIQTQSVSYIVQRMNGLATLFYLSAFLLYIRGRKRHERERITAYGLAGVSWLLALGSKEIALTLPAAIWLYEWFFFRNLEWAFARRTLLTFWLPLGAVAFLLYYILIWGPDFGYAKRDFDMVERQLTQFRVLILYLGLLAYPHPGRLNLAHDIPISHGLLDPVTTATSLIALVSLFAVGVRLSSHWRVAAFGIFWFFLHLAMESSIISLEMVYEHRTYLPMAGIAIAVSHLLFTSAVPFRAAACGSVAVVIALAAATHVRNEVWRNGLALWGDVVAKSPELPRAHNNLGAALGRSGQMEASVPKYEEALRLQPRFAEALRNLGGAKLALGEPEESLRYMLESLRIKPESYLTLGGLADALAELGRLDEAAASYELALHGYPDERLFNGLGRVRYQQGKLEEAAHFFSWSLKTNPEFGIARINLGSVLIDQGRVDEALAQFFEVLEHVDDPQTHAHIGNALWSKGEPGPAIEHLEEAIRLAPSNPVVMNNLGWMLAAAPDAALRDPSRALELTAAVLEQTGIRDPGVLDTQGVSYAALGRFDEAIEVARDGIDRARELGDRELADEIAGRLELYRRGQVYLEVVGVE